MRLSGGRTWNWGKLGKEERPKHCGIERSSCEKGERGPWRWTVEPAENKPNWARERQSMRRKEWEPGEPGVGGGTFIYTPAPQRAQTTSFTIPPP